MSLRRDFRIKRLLTRYNRAVGAERTQLYGEIRHLLTEGRDEAVERNSYFEYCTYATPLGQLLLEGPDPSDALRPFGCSYVTACIAGDRLTNERVAAAEGLSAAYAMLGDYGFAAECGFEALYTAEKETERFKLYDILVFLSNADSDDDFIRQIYDVLRPELDQAGADWARPIQAILDARFGLISYHYESLVAAAGILQGQEYKDLTWTAQQAFAAAALVEGRLHEAAMHIDQALDHMEMENTPWLKAPLLGLSARIRYETGDPDLAYDLAMEGWATVLPTMLWCKDDFARRSVQLLASGCIDIATTVAHERRNWSLLTALIENSRLQSAAAATTVADAQVAEKYPDWIIDRLLDALKNRAVRAGIQAVMTGDWKSSLSDQVIPSHQGQSALAEAVERTGVELTGRQFAYVDAFETIGDLLGEGAVAWAAVVRHGSLFWTLSDVHGSFDGGILPMEGSDMARSLTALRSLVLSEFPQALDVNDVPIDPLRALAEEGSFDELKLMGPLRALIPPYLTTVALQRSQDDPLRVLFLMPPELSCVPWAVVPLSAPNLRAVRLVERIELHIITPTAVRARAPRPQSYGPSIRPIVLSCCNPARDLLPWDPVKGTITLDGGLVGSDTSLEKFLDIVEHWDPPSEGVLFVRSHLGSDSSAGYIADQGIAFADGVLSARSLNLRQDDGSPVCRLPGRVVLALCSGAGSADTAGLSLGLAAACRLAGAEEVVTTLFDVIDSTWSCALDHRLAEIATRPEGLATSLRVLQLECLAEWRAAAATVFMRPPDEGPTPLAWAAYGVVN